MSFVRGTTLGALAAAALALGSAGCQRADERASIDHSPAVNAPNAAPRAASRAVVAAGGVDTRTMGGSPADATKTMGNAPERFDDASITGKVAVALAVDQELRALRIDVDTQNGIVTLSGPAPTATAKEHAAEVARAVHGVVSVNNQLTLTAG
jgi:osmotically-inducible protein OsmY